jgi:hypothetical protein
MESSHAVGSHRLHPLKYRYFLLRSIRTVELFLHVKFSILGRFGFIAQQLGFKNAFCLVNGHVARPEYHPRGVSGHVRTTYLICVADGGIMKALAAPQ